ncbi:MAG: cyclic pyranopterin monophosphate synthase MoaC [Verrucomicrobiota bacterium]
MKSAVQLTHLDAQNRPAMVDVGGKAVTRRTAHAVSRVALPPALARLVTGNEIQSKKGPLFQTAILAGIMGAKQTSGLIPLCHPLPLDDCRIEIEAGPPGADGAAEVTIHCHASVAAKTGVEMEALTGATIAALTLYDMGKAVSHGIVIREIRLLEKTGGKNDYHAAR